MHLHNDLGCLQTLMPLKLLLKLYDAPEQCFFTQNMKYIYICTFVYLYVKNLRGEVISFICNLNFESVWKQK